MRLTAYVLSTPFFAFLRVLKVRPAELAQRSVTVTDSLSARRAPSQVPVCTRLNEVLVCKPLHTIEMPQPHTLRVSDPTPDVLREPAIHVQ